MQWSCNDHFWGVFFVLLFVFGFFICLPVFIVYFLVYVCSQTAQLFPATHWNNNELTTIPYVRYANRERQHPSLIQSPLFAKNLKVVWWTLGSNILVHNITIKTNKDDLCFSAINGSGPAYLSELLHVYTPSRTQRSSSDTRVLKIQ